MRSDLRRGLGVEVARLHLEGLAGLAAGAHATIHLHPPLLRALGLERKPELGPWFTPVLWLLRAGRRLRGTFLDPFGRAHVRRIERALPGENLGFLDAVVPELGPLTLERALEVAAQPDLVRGYENIKLPGVAAFALAPASS